MNKKLITHKRFFPKIKKPTRMLSGVIIVAVMTAPYPCPHGKCIYCPGGPDQNTPQSYISKSPAVMRALNYNYDPYKQTWHRLRQYEAMGHKPSKIEIIVMGGTFPAMPIKYQRWFIKKIFQALNDFPRYTPNKNNSLVKEIRRNEKAKIRCVGLTIETRPDWSKDKHVDLFLELAATRIELGVQSIYDDVLEKVRRGHSVKDSIDATRILKDAGYKVVYHMMPGLPGSDIDKDYEMFVELFNNPDFRPDMLKIYPTLVMPSTVLYTMWKRGLYRPYSDEEIIDLVAKIKNIIPPYVRIMRVQRDVPISSVAAGLKIGNFREVVQNYMEEKGMKCRCIRCREIGRYIIKKGIIPNETELKMVKYYYEASGGLEVFISFEDPSLNILYGFLRLRKPSELAHRPEIDEKSSIVRELHVYGPQIPLGEKTDLWWQHRGLGKRLLKEAERIASEELDASKIFIISGVGVREYYRNMGYRRYKGSFYMYKKLN